MAGWYDVDLSNHELFDSITLMLGEIRFAFRKLRQSPGFTPIAVMTFAIDIGLNTAISSGNPGQSDHCAPL